MSSKWQPSFSCFPHIARQGAWPTIVGNENNQGCTLDAAPNLFAIRLPQGRDRRPSANRLPHLCAAAQESGATASWHAPSTTATMTVARSTAPLELASSTQKTRAEPSFLRRALPATGRSAPLLAHLLRNRHIRASAELQGPVLLTAARAESNSGDHRRKYDHALHVHGLLS